MEKTLLISLILLFTVFLQFSTAVDYYVDTSGSDGGGNDGSAGKPWKTVNYSIGQLSPGDTLHLAAGQTFSEQVYFAPGSGGTAGNPVTLTTDSGNPANISSPNVNNHACYIYNTGYITFSNIVFQGQGMDVSNKDGVNAYADDARYPGLQFIGCTFTGFGKSGLVIGGWGGAAYGFSDVLVQDCVSHDNRTCGMSTYGEYASANTNVTFRNCTVYNNLGDPAASSHTGSGIVLGGVTDGLMEYCIAYNNGERCTTTGGPVGLWMYQCTRVTIQYCEAYQNHAVNCDGGGFDIDGGAQDCIIQYCYSHDNDGPGFLICQYSGARAYTDNIVRYNISENDARKNGFGGLHFYSSGSNGGLVGTLIYGNTIYNEYTYTVRFQNTSGQTGTKLWNNIFITDNNKILVSGSPSTSVAKFEGNCYWASGGTFSVAGYSTLAAWRTAKSQEVKGGSDVGFKADPLVGDAGNGGTIGDTSLLSNLTAYKLTDSSPCINTGIDIAADYSISTGTQDFYGNTIPVDSAFDVGAHDRAAPAATAPEMNVKGNSQNITDGDTSPSVNDHTDFGSISVSGGAVSRTFTVENSGDAELILSGTPKVAVSGTGAGAFTVIVEPSSPVAVSGSTTFTVSFDPSAAQVYNAVLSIDNNDSDENPYNFSIRGTGTADPEPEIEIQGNGAVINDGDITPSSADHTDFGGAVIGTGSVVRTFTVSNTGDADLTVSGISLAGSDAGEYSVSSDPTPTVLSPGTDVDFQITFSPSAAGAQDAEVQVTNDDADEALYTFAVTGTGTAAPEPEIEITGNSTVISDGDTTPSTADHTSFGGTDIAAGSVTRTFTIENSGDADLYVSDISLGGTDAGEFSVSSDPSPVTLGPGGTADFDVTFDPSSAGLLEAEVQVSSDDSDESLYTFAISGTGTDVNPDDLDGDGMDDTWESENGVDDPDGDPDGDLVTNLEEFQHGTDPNLVDSDGDLYSDREEIDAGYDPLDPHDNPANASENTKVSGCSFSGTASGDSSMLVLLITGLLGFVFKRRSLKNK